MKSKRAEGGSLIEPCGGKLVDLLIPPEDVAEAKRYANSLPSIRLSERSICDLELLATGAFSPLDRFMGPDDYRSVLGSMRLASGHIFPIPVTLPISDADGVREGKSVALRDQRNDLLAVMEVEEIYPWDPAGFQTSVLGTTDAAHPLVAESNRWGNLNVSGRLKVVELPRHYDFPELRLTPRQVRTRLEALGPAAVIAFQTRNPLHRAHEELIRQAIERTGGTLLLHPAVGVTKPGDVDHVLRVRTYQELIERFFKTEEALLAILPLAMRLAGPREALWHAVIRRNYGADHLIVGRDHASPGSDSLGQPFYDPFAAQALVAEHSSELGVVAVPFGEVAYVPSENSYREIGERETADSVVRLSGSQLRREYLKTGGQIPDWFMRPETASILAGTQPSVRPSGFCVWFTGLSGAGKSTTAELLTARLTRLGRTVTLLDGDIVRSTLCAGLGFDKEGRDANVRRIGFVASEIARHGGIAVCAAISPYRETRDEVRRMFPPGSFIEVFVDTPLGVCESRDTKGMYARARSGELQNFTGVSDVYEPPFSSEITVDTVNASAVENSGKILEHLLHAALLPDSDD